MRSPFLVPLVLLTLLMLLTCADAAESNDSKSMLLEDNVEMVENKSKKTKITDEKVLAAVESNLMSLFGFSKRPRRRARDIVIPQAMRDLYRRQSGLDVETTNLALPGRHTASANTVRAFTHTESAIDDQFKKRHRFRLFFNTNSIPKSEELQSAELQLSASHARHILVHDIVRPGVVDGSGPIHRLIDSRRVHPSPEGVIRLDVTPAVERWLSSPEGNHGLLIVVQDGESDPEGSHVRLKRDVRKEEWRDVQPILYTYTDDGKQKKRGSLVNRPRRGARKHKRKDGRDICKRHDLYVDFEDVGWTDWIVAPPGYTAYYCAGDCPFPLSDHLNSTNHAIVQTLVNSIAPSSTPKACCVPTTLSTVSMLYINEENTVVLKNYEDMAIEGCGCR